MVLFQGGYYFLDSYLIPEGPHLELNANLQAQIDSLKLVQVEKNRTSFTVNPNFLSDYRAYLLGMAPEEIDRLQLFRDKDKWIRSAVEFQKVTGISDSLFQAIVPFLKFPAKNKTPLLEKPKLKYTVVKKDLNTATATDLESIYGIGKVLSKRMIKFRNALGGFLIEGQLSDVYGLEEDVINNVLERYEIRIIPVIEPISINHATVSELASLVYLSWDTAKEIVRYRDSVGGFSKWEEITTVKGFPIDKIERIKLYLTL